MTLRVVAIADTDSYVKWAAALLGTRTPEAAARRGEPAWDVSLLVLETPLVVSAAQEAAALAGSGLDAERAERVRFANLVPRLETLAPDAVVLAARGPLVRVLAREIGSLDPRPVIVSGLPGISIPATRKALIYRDQTDALILHSHREVREFTALAGQTGIDQRFLLATLPFAAHARPDPAHRTAGADLVFAPQAKVPAGRADRLRVARMLVDAARADPSRRVVLKLRGTAGEAQTHVERDAYPALLESVGGAPANLVVSTESMGRALDTAACLVTVSSTAAIEAIARGVPVVALDEFGVSRELINLVFEGSGLFAGAADVIAGRGRQPRPQWLRENYFHAPDEADWRAGVERLVELRRSGVLAPRPARRHRGGALRLAWDRKQAIGADDRSLTSALAIVVGVPTRAVVRFAERTRSRLAGGSMDAHSV
ncbi:DUF6716 putative glycosyltransferase [Microbacterium sp. BWT-B31]|uniref:DUF6716 putative glycosyltransferase n=1 Tax=Microbacterium sp. BWT-B31 TaxID=3232072 RepID=UPI00352975CB